MLVHQLLGNEGILLIHPDGPIAVGDFEAVADQLILTSSTKEPCEAS